MSRSILRNLTAEMFKGIHSFAFEPNGDNKEIVAENEKGKTSVADSFYWLLADKDSTERKQFDFRPLRRDNTPVKGVVVSVSGTIDVDGTNHVLRKENHEKKSRGIVVGHETKCWIDDTPMKVSEYQGWITENIAPVDILRLVMNLHYFCENEKKGGIHHDDRRKIILNVAGKIGEPEGYEEMLAECGSRKLKDYKKALLEQKGKLEDELRDIKPAIQTLLEGLEHSVDVDVAELTEKQTKIKDEISELKGNRQEVRDNEKGRQDNINRKNLLVVEQKKREGDLVSDTSAIQDLINEKSQIADEVGKAKQAVSTAESELGVEKTKMTGLNNETATLLAGLNTIRGEYRAADEKKESTVCYACGSALLADKLAENENKRTAKIQEVTKRGNDLNEKFRENKEKVEALAETIKDAEHKRDKALAELDKCEDGAEKRLAEIDEAVKTRPTPVPQEDEKWLEYDGKIQELDQQIGEPVTEQLTAINNKLDDLDSELKITNDSLALPERFEKDKARIEEKEHREKELGQLIANKDKRLNEIKLYKMAQNELIAEAVNDKFEVAEFKMFKKLLNGETEPCCEVMFGGVPYAELSKGRKIRMGLDVVKTLSKHYGVTLPLFIDEIESYGLAITNETQIIGLRFVKGVKQLQIQTKTETRKAVA